MLTRFSNLTEVLASLKVGNEEAFRWIYEKYWDKIYVVGYNRLRDKEIVEEFIQDIFTELWEKRETLNIHTNLEGYLASSLKYKILNYFRHQKVKQQHFRENHSLIPVGENTTLNQLSFEELFEKMEQEINKLPEKCSLVFRLSRQKGYSMKEIAEEVNISVKTVEAHIGKAIKHLREGLGDYTSLLVIYAFTLFL